MLTIPSNKNTTLGYLGQQTMQANSGGNIDESSENKQVSDDTVALSQKARELKQKYNQKETGIEQKYLNESQQLEREYLQEKKRLENEFQMKKKSMGIDMYV